MNQTTSQKANAAIVAISFALPVQRLTNEALAVDFPGGGIEKIAEKTGIYCRHIAAPDECASDLAVDAARKMFRSKNISPDEIDYLIFCTQSPDYFLPTSACIIQDRLGLSTRCGAIDINQGCSGFIYALGLAEALIGSNQVSTVLILTADTYSKYLAKGDRTVRTLFGDAGTSTLVRRSTSPTKALKAFVYGSDGSGSENLIVRGGANRTELVSGEVQNTDEKTLVMNGPEVLSFTLRILPDLVCRILSDASTTLNDIDFIVPHQANKFMLDALARKLGCHPEKLIHSYANTGNTVSSTIPIALASAAEEGTLTSGMRLLLLGFGVGYSWAGCIARWEI